jgi:hypothetical protein
VLLFAGDFSVMERCVVALFSTFYKINISEVFFSAQNVSTGEMSDKKMTEFVKLQREKTCRIGKTSVWNPVA